MRARLVEVRCEAQRLYDDLGGEEGAWSAAWLKGLPRRNDVYRRFGRRVGWRVTADSDVADLFGVWMYGLPRVVRHTVLEWFGVLGLRNAPTGWARCVAKALSTAALQEGPWAFGPTWHYLVGLHRLFGSQPDAGAAVAALAEDVRSWVGPKAHSPELERVFAVGWGDVLRRARGVALGRAAAYGEPSSVKFAATPSRWLVNGASTAGGMDGVLSGKYATYLAHRPRIAGVAAGSDSLDEYPGRARVIAKREREKVRAVINAGFDLYVQQAFVFQGMGKLVREVCRTPPEGGEPTLRFWDGLVADAKRAYCLPLDYPKFDHIPSWGWISRVLDDMAQLLRGEGAAARERCRAWERARATMAGASLLVAGEEVPYHGGVLSGWYVTSDLDTLINAALEAGMRITQRLETTAPSAVKGDDALVFAPNRAEARRWLSTFRRVFRLDLARFPTDGQRGEFLRYVIGGGLTGRRGYPTRAAAALLWGQAWQGGGLEDAGSIAGQAAVLVSRGMDRESVERMLVARLASHFGVVESEAARWLHTPTAVGGAGWLPTTHGVWLAAHRECETVTLERGVAVATRRDDLPPKAQDQVTAAMAGLGLPPAAADGLVAGLRLRDGLAGAARQRLVRAAWQPLPPERSLRWAKVAPPRWGIDPGFAGSLVAAGYDWRPYALNDQERVRLEEVERWLGRGWFRTWAGKGFGPSMPGEPRCSRTAMAAWGGDGVVGGGKIPFRNPRSSGGMMAGLLRCELGLASAGLASALGD